MKETQSMLQQIPGRWQRYWQQHLPIEQWTAFQKIALHACFEQEDSVLCLAPTGVGKTMLGQLLACCHLAKGQRVLWLVPTRSLAAQMQSRLLSLFPQGEISCRVETGNALIGSREEKIAEADVLIATYERWAGLIANQADLLAGTGLVVLDELGTIADRERGGLIDRLCVSLATHPYQPRLLGLVADARADERVKDWWPGAVVQDFTRELALHEGVLEAGRWQWLQRPDDDGCGADAFFEDFPDAEEYQHRLKELRAMLPEAGQFSAALETSLALAISLARRGQPTMFFVNTRENVRRMGPLLARLLGDGVDNETVDAKSMSAIADVVRREPCHDHALVLECLKQGVGLHHADLSPAMREALERVLLCERQAGVRLWVTTSTLAQGMQMRVRNVIHWPQRSERDHAGQWQAGYLPWAQWRQQGGRAGRMGTGQVDGRSLLIACGVRQARELLGRYPSRQIEQPPPLATTYDCDDQLPRNLLAWLVGDVMRSTGNFESLVRRLLARQAEDCPSKLSLEQTLSQLADADLIQPVPGGWRLSSQGQLAASWGLDHREWQALTPLLAWRPGEKIASDALAVVILAQTLPDQRWTNIQLRSRPAVAARVVAWLGSEAEERCRALPGGNSWWQQLWGVERECLDRWELAWRQAYWITVRDPMALESKVWVTSGTLQRQGEALAWWAQCLAARLRWEGAECAIINYWQRLADRLESGVGEVAAGMAGFAGAYLPREALWRLGEAGLESAEHVLEVEEAYLTQLLQGDLAGSRQLRKLASRAIRHSQGCQSTSSLPVIAPVKSSEEIPAARSVDSGGEKDVAGDQPASGALIGLAPVLEIDLGSPGVVRSGEKEIVVAPLSFDLLKTLACSPGKVMRRRALYDQLWPGGGPEDQQLDAHRRRLIRSLRPLIGSEAVKVAQVVRGVGFRCNLPDSAIRVYDAG